MQFPLKKGEELMSKIKLGVIFGGISTEHEVSVISATSVIKNLDKEKYEIFPIYISKEGKWYEYIKKVEEIQIAKIGEKVEPIQEIENEFHYLKKLDVVFPVLHGLGGEDGSLQGMLELLKIRYVGCRILSSCICMDKAYSKIIFKNAQIPQAKYVYIKAEKETNNNQTQKETITQKKDEKINNYQQVNYYYVSEEQEEQKIEMAKITSKVKQKLGFPVFVKPANSGSSVGIQKAKNEQELEQAINYARQFDSKILIEEEIIGREVECAVLGNNIIQATCVGEILPAEEFYTFDAKYKNAQSRVVIPAKIEEQKQEEIKKLAIKAFKAVDGKGLARVDFFIKQENGEIIINEINTMPGFTQISMYPKLWEAVGISYPKLLDKLIELAY